MIAIGPLRIPVGDAFEVRALTATEDGYLAALDEVDRAASNDELLAPGLRAFPGFVDLQINGGWGHDFTSKPESIWDVAVELPRCGVTSFLPTIISSADETIEEAIAVLRAGPPAGFAGAVPLGLHLEGPFLEASRAGAHDAGFLRAPGDEPPAWTTAPEIAMLTLAPEIPGTMDLARTLSARGVLVAAGHSNCNVATARRSFKAGVRYGTHLFNAMSGIHHREPGLATALLAARAITTGAIVDGIHLHPDVVAMAWRTKGPHRFNLVSDAVAAAGMPDGSYVLGNQEVVVADEAVRLADGTLAGSSLTLDRAVRNLVTFTRCSLVDAIATVTTTPASLLPFPVGRLEIGAAADITVVDDGGHVVACFVRGRRLR